MDGFRRDGAGEQCAGLLKRAEADYSKGKLGVGLSEWEFEILDFFVGGAEETCWPIVSCVEMQCLLWNEIKSQTMV